VNASNEPDEAHDRYFEWLLFGVLVAAEIAILA